jgi:hypothetical protein
MTGYPKAVDLLESFTATRERLRQQKGHVGFGGQLIGFELSYPSV